MERPALNRPSSKRVTLRDLAAELGLSQRSVSQALNPRESNVKLRPDTIERVQKLALEWNYRPDSRARSMRYGRFYNIGYFEAKKTAEGWPLLGAESGVFDEASSHGYRVALIRLPSDSIEAKDSIPAIFREGNLDALILSHAGNLTREVEEVIDQSGFPIVYLNEKKKYNAVYAEDRRGMSAMTEYLISLGHRNIAYFNTSMEDAHYSVKDRRQGYMQAIKKAELKPTVLEIPSSDPDWESQILEWFEAHREVEAVATYSDFSALALLRCLYPGSIKVPQNLSVTGFGDDFAKECSPVPLTTMKTPFYAMGRVAVEMAMELIENDQKPIPARRFPVELVIRKSTT